MFMLVGAVTIDTLWCSIYRYSSLVAYECPKLQYLNITVKKGG